MLTRDGGAALCAHADIINSLACLRLCSITAVLVIDHNQSYRVATY